MKSSYIFNKSTEVNPVDRNSIFIEVNYDNGAIINQAYPQVGIKNLRFAREDVSLFYDWAKNSSTGIFYAPYFDIVLTKNNTYTVPCYLDLTDGFMYSVDGVEVSIKLYMSLDWLNDVVDSFTFDSIAGLAVNSAVTLQNTWDAAGIISSVPVPNSNQSSRVIYIPYVISTIPNYLQVFTSMLTCFSMVMLIQKEIAAIAGLLGQIAGVFSSFGGVIGFIAELAYITIMGLAIYSCFSNFIYSIIQPVKYHAALLLTDLIEATCMNMGLQFQSSIFQDPTNPMSRVALLPEKYIPVQSGNGGATSFSIGGMLSVPNLVGGYTKPNPENQQGYPLITGGELLSLAKKLVNGKILLQTVAGKPTLILERRDYVPNTPTYNLPDIREDWNGYNTKEFFATTTISFAKDLNDKNTYDQYQGQVLSAVITPTNAPDPLCQLTKGLRRIDIAAARGIRKETLTIPETIMNTLSDALYGFGEAIESVEQGILDIVDGIIDIWNGVIDVLYDLDIIDKATKNSLIINKPGNAVNPFANDLNAYKKRIGMLLMEHDLVDTPKLLLLGAAGQNDPATGDPYQYTLSGSDTADGSTQKVCTIDVMNSSVINALYLWNYFYDIDCWLPVGSYQPQNYSNQVPNNGITNTYYDTQGNGCKTPPPPTADVGKHNQFTLWSPALDKSSDENKLSLSFTDYGLLFNNNTLNDSSGKPCIVDSLAWHFEENWAALQYRRNEIYTNNLTALVTLPTGE